MRSYWRLDHLARESWTKQLWQWALEAENDWSMASYAPHQGWFLHSEVSLVEHGHEEY
jgi:hypothetical protein